MDGGWSKVRMKDISKLFVMFIAVFVFILSNSATLVSAEESGCASCHTSIKKLIEITRDIEASKPEAEEPAESEGEG